MASAQSCLDGARTSEQADQCYSIVEGLTTPDAYLIKCSANFVAQGFSGQKIADVLQSISNNTGDNSTVALMGHLNFNNSIGNGQRHTATNTVLNCRNSGSVSMLRLATAAELATTVQGLVDPTLLSGNDPVANMQAAIDSLSNGTIPAGGAAAVGQVATTVSGAFCGPGSTYESEDICKDLNNAINTANPADYYASIGEKLLDLLNSATH
ncbi:MAG: hypothetical protein EOP05_12320 [Proteobacteria bacterium]|nr:MAG: hypothetical protein EOP05_12320 [Pseudomonadota bacterium]